MNIKTSKFLQAAGMIAVASIPFFAMAQGATGTIATDLSSIKAIAQNIYNTDGNYNRACGTNGAKQDLVIKALLANITKKAGAAISCKSAIMPGPTSGKNADYQIAFVTPTPSQTSSGSPSPTPISSATPTPFVTSTTAPTPTIPFASVIPTPIPTPSVFGAPSVTPTPVPSITTTPQNKNLFRRDLLVGSQGADVKALQVYLNSHNAVIAVSGAGSKGKESEYFGNATKSALSKWQSKNGLDVTGVLDRSSRQTITLSNTPSIYQYSLEQRNLNTNQ